MSEYRQLAFGFYSARFPSGKELGREKRFLPPQGGLFGLDLRLGSQRVRGTLESPIGAAAFGDGALLSNNPVLLPAVSKVEAHNLKRSSVEPRCGRPVSAGMMSIHGPYLDLTVRTGEGRRGTVRNE